MSQKFEMPQEMADRLKSEGFEPNLNCDYCKKPLISFDEKHDISDCAAFMKSTITAQEDIIKRLREDVESLNNLSECYLGQHHMPGEICNRCGYCPTCPITLHSQLMNKLGEQQ